MAKQIRHDERVRIEELLGVGWLGRTTHFAYVAA